MVTIHFECRINIIILLTNVTSSSSLHVASVEKSSEWTFPVVESTRAEQAKSPSPGVDEFAPVMSDLEVTWDYHSDIAEFDGRSDLFCDIGSSPDNCVSSPEIQLIKFLCQCRVLEVIRRVRRTYEGVERAAERDAATVKLPDDFFTRDAIALQQQGSLEKLITYHQHSRSNNRFNLERFNNLYQDDEEADMLRILATTGARIDTAPDFVPIAEPDEMRSLQRRLPLTFQKHVLKLWLSGNVLVLPLAEILGAEPHISPLHCVFQDPLRKPGGRLLGDLSNRSVGNSLNNIHAKAAIIERFGVLSLPSIVEIILHIIEVADKVGGMQNVRILKEDVVGAFGQFNFDCRDCRYVVFSFAPGFVIVYTTGMFGYSGCPFIFGVHSRSILRQIRLRIHKDSRADMYCDDVMVFAGVEVADDDQEVVVDVVEGTFGPETVCPEKKQRPSKTGELIGWYLDVGKATIRPNNKGIDSLTRAFLTLNETQTLTRREYQVLASLACRYSRGLRGMRPFVRPFFTMMKSTHYKKRAPSAVAWTAILMWQAIIICLILAPDQLAVSLYSFAKISSDRGVRLISDAGPVALGLAIYVHDQCIGYVSYVLPFDARDPCYQNCREFMGHLLGKILLLKLKHQNSCVAHVTTLHWTGDNMSALAWVAKQSCSSTNTQMAFLADCWLSTIHNIITTDVDHRAGVDMDDHDGLSRLKAHSFDPKLNLDHLITSDVDALFSLCDPTAPDINFTTGVFERLLMLLVGMDTC